MIKKISLFLLIVCCNCWQLCAQVSKTIHQTFTLESADVVNVDLSNATDVHYKATKGSRILVETKIQLSIPNQSLLEFVVNNGRYNLTKQLDNTTRQLTLASNKKNDVIVVKGQECRENVSYTFYLPSTAKLTDDAALLGVR